jgi:hypothetical protein
MVTVKKRLVGVALGYSDRDQAALNAPGSSPRANLRRIVLADVPKARRMALAPLNTEGERSWSIVRGWTASFKGVIPDPQSSEILRRRLAFGRLGAIVTRKTAPIELVTEWTPRIHRHGETAKHEYRKNYGNNAEWGFP